MPAIWVDAQLSPAIATWIPAELGLPAQALRDVGLRDADDTLIFLRARTQDAIIMTKDADFPLLLQRLGPPPRIIWLTCGNTTNTELRHIITRNAAALTAWISGTESLIELR
jgi:predicted nuclease of predicted toxin-antitoxin system